MAQDDWFEIRRIRSNLWMIVEPLQVTSFLYVGAERAALIDTGTGIVPIAPVVAGLTDKPVTVVNTHYHFDHIGGNASYETRLCGTRAAPLIARPSARDLLRRYLGGLPPMVALAEAKIAIDKDAFALAPELRARPLPAGFDADLWRPGSVPPTGVLKEGDTIDLGGGTRLSVLDTPGHSPDGICLFDAREGLLFVGDTLTEGALYAHYDESSTADLLHSVRKLAALGDAVRLIGAGHIARAVGEVTLIAETAVALSAVLAGNAPFADAIDIFDYPIREARFGRVWITQPHPDAGPIVLAD